MFRIKRSDCSIEALYTDVGESLVYEYVWATIDTKQEQLLIYYREKNVEKAGLIKIYEYKIS